MTTTLPMGRAEKMVSITVLTMVLVFGIYIYYDVVDWYRTTEPLNQ